MCTSMIHDTFIPQMLEEMDPELWDQLEERENKAKVELLKCCGLTKVCADTVEIWLKKLSFS